MGRADRGHAPGQRPAVAVEHGQRPQVPAGRRQLELQRDADRVEVRAAVGVDHALGPAGRPAGVVHRDHAVLVAGELQARAVAAGQPGTERLRAGQRPVRRAGQQHHPLHRDLVRAGHAQPLDEPGGQQQGPRPGVGQDLEVLGRGQPRVQRHQHAAGTGYPVVRGQQPAAVEVQDRHPVAGPHAAGPQRARERVTVPAQLRVADLGPVGVHDRRLPGEDPARPVQEPERGQRHMIGTADHEALLSGQSRWPGTAHLPER